MGWYHEYFMKNWSYLIATESTDDKSTLVQAVAWCRNTAIQYLKYCLFIPICRYMASLGQYE